MTYYEFNYNLIKNVFIFKEIFLFLEDIMKIIQVQLNHLFLELKKKKIIIWKNI